MKKLPKNWVETTLGEILKLKNGYAFKSHLYQNFGVPVIRISDIKQGFVTTDNSVCVEEDEELKRFILTSGDVLIAMSGATTGKFGIYSSDVIAYQNQRVGNLVPSSDNISRRFIYYLLGGLKTSIEEKAYGGAQPNISASLIEALVINLPPLPEQQRIVAKLDSLFASLDQVKARMEKIPDLLKQFRQSVLTQAVTGKLTESTFETWALVKIKDLVDKIEAGKSFKCIEKSVEKGEVGIVKVSAVTWGRFNEKETKTVNDESLINPKYFIKKGDFLMSRANTIELVGAVVIVEKIEHKIMLSDKIWRVLFNNNETKHFIKSFLKSKIGRNEIESRSSGNQLSMRNLSQKEFLNIELRIPSVVEQTEIVNRVEALFSKADRIQEKYEALKAQIDTLPQAILAKAFKGELVEQLPTDGDARELLKEIAQMKVETGKKKRRAAR